MKIFSSEQLNEADKITTEKQQISSADLMEGQEIKFLIGWIIACKELKFQFISFVVLGTMGVMDWLLAVCLLRVAITYICLS
jgi:hypothetical protein